jgi:predicted amidohydrolase YtcJ
MENGKAMVVPGFMDGHAHFLRGGFQLTSVDLRDAATPAEFIARIKAFAAKSEPGEWILLGTWDHEKWPGTPLPDRSWIDSVTPNNPVFVDRLDGHMALANSLALEKAGVTRSTPEIPGGTIVRRPNGEPTGVLKDEAQNPVFAIIPTPSERQSDAALSRAMEWAARASLPWPMWTFPGTRWPPSGEPTRPGSLRPGSACMCRSATGTPWLTRCVHTEPAMTAFESRE